MKKSILFILCILTLVSGVQAQTSPNGKIKVSEASGRLSVVFNDEGEWYTVMKLDAQIKSSGQSEMHKVKYDMPIGKKSHCTNAYSQQEYALDSGETLCIRVYNDGIAWSGTHSSTVDFSTSINNWLMRWTDSYEEFFPQNRSVREGMRLAYPALFEYKDDVFALLTESDLKRTSAASSMYGTTMTNVFEIRPDGNEEPGWQTLIIGTLSDIVESTLVTDNSTPCQLDDTSWIEPGTASWIYWANNHGSNDFSIIKKYVDMAAELHLPYVLIDAEWDGMPDLASNEGKDIEEAVRYAVENGVKPMIWYSSSIGWVNGAPGPKYRLNTPENMEKEFSWCESIGVRGVKIDFFSGDTNENMQFMTDLMECAAKHHLLINFHGATTMRGWQRTYPNLITTEAVYGAEWYNNTPTFTSRAAAHNATLPFTRNVIGSMDYTPCAFSDSQHPHITTHAHELALTALFESAMQHLADRPESFLAQPQEVKDYLGTLPTVWDETRYIAGYPGESAVLARRNGSDWYIAGINGQNEAQVIDISGVRELKIKGRKAIMFADSDDEEHPWCITSLDGKKSIPQSVTCRPRGGFLIVIRK